MRPLCWICLGDGFVSGPLHWGPCPNIHCPHRRREIAADPRWVREMIRERRARRRSA